MSTLLRGGSRLAEAGASAVEYGLLISGIAVVLVVAILALGGATKGMFSNSCSTLNFKASTGQAC